MYYNEEKIKDTSYRQNYKNSINAFLEAERSRAKERRFGFFTPDEYADNPEKFRNAFIDMLGFPLRESREDKTTSEKSFVATDGNVNIYRMVLKISGIDFYGIYFEQTKSKDSAPFVIALHGGEGTPETVSSIHDNSSNYNHLARRLTDRGCNVFCPQLLLWNEPTYGNPYSRSEINSRLILLGGSVTALELYLLSRSIDYFIKSENINAKRIGVAGLSYGGQFALDLAAVDTRIKVCHSACYFNDRFRYPKEDWCYFNAMNTVGDAEKAALVCPRALSIAVGNEDYLFAPDGAVEESKRAVEFYKKFNRNENFDFYVFGGSHETDKSDRWVDFMIKHI